ncbi:MAG: LysR family transcriptional regulator [Pseudomonadota bacterium]
MNELACLRAFVRVVEAGSFTAAARQSGTVKSVITKRVNQLEAHLGLLLIQRSTRRLTITDAGAAFYERAVHLLAELDHAKAVVSSVEWGLSGQFRVSCVPSFTAAYLAEDLCDFQSDHPDLAIELQQHARFCDPVQEGFDVCLQAGGGHSGILEKVDILPLRRLLVATPGYLARAGNPDTPEALSTHRFAHNNHVEPDCVVPFVVAGRRQDVAIAPTLLTNSTWLLRAAVLRGEHMAMLPAFFIEAELVSGALVPVLPAFEIAYPQLSAYYRRTAHVPMKVRIFINFLRQRYGETPVWEQRILAARPELSAVFGGSAD